MLAPQLVRKVRILRAAYLCQKYSYLISPYKLLISRVWDMVA
jgi:hypothetical protein